MDFNKLKESGRKIKMPEEMKLRIKGNCIKYKTPDNDSKSQWRFDGRVAFACVCCFLLLIGTGLKYGGVSVKKFPIESTTSYSTANFLSVSVTEKSTIKQILETTVKVIYTENSTKSAITEENTSTETYPPIQGTELFSKDENIHNSQPMTLYMDDLNKLKNAKKAAETMDDEHYRTYLDEKNYYDVGDCFYFPEEYLKFCSSEICVPVVDENNSEIMWFDYVPAYESINMGVNFDETDSFRFYIEMSGDFYFRTNEEGKYDYIETVYGEDYIADIYKKKLLYKLKEENWAWGGWYCVEVLINGQGINILTTEYVTLEEIREYLSYIKFVKIKDWI